MQLTNILYGPTPHLPLQKTLHYEVVKAVWFQLFQKGEFSTML